jgi:hypothetical protein
VNDPEYMVFPVIEFERLTDRLRRMVELIETHSSRVPLRDADVPSDPSGLASFWRCEAEIQDLRETVRALQDVIDAYESRLNILEPLVRPGPRRPKFPGDQGWVQDRLGL